ncbi:uncharacterized protein C11orf98 homolog [Onychostruthus taczanowskii]|uniref:uncharacterized protein C11orf98 homolog n=1 Tax=Onychostruthus taczanowskii TaxID=356909 RepID=UPI001B80B5D1|nr:uncharacterized protein C11orf98 homolog [Onychostruthus taczanowskii]
MIFAGVRKGAGFSDRKCGRTGSWCRTGSGAGRVGAMGIGGKINRPRTELRKKLFKRRRERARGRRQKRRSLSVPAVRAPVWGKRLRKELKRLRGASRRALTAAASEAKRPREEPGRASGDVEMAE